MDTTNTNTATDRITRDAEEALDALHQRYWAGQLDETQREIEARAILASYREQLALA